MGVGLSSYGPEDYAAGLTRDQQQWKSVGYESVALALFLEQSDLGRE